MLAGCASTPPPLFPRIEPALVWPPPPDKPRIELVGELRGPGAVVGRPRGWAAVGAALTGAQSLPDEFVGPSAVAVSGEHVFVIDGGAKVVYGLALDTREVWTLTGPPNEPLLLPIDLDFWATQLVIADRLRDCLYVTDPRGTTWHKLPLPAGAAPVAVAIDAPAGAAWVADVANHCLWRVPLDGRPPQQYGRRGDAPGEFNFPTGLVCDPNLGLVVADAMNFRVQTLDPNGTPRSAFGKKGNGAGDFARPRDVAIDRDGHIYVLDNQFENVQIFDDAGRLLLAFATGGHGRGDLSVPAGLCIDATNRIWVADTFNHRLQVFRYLPEEP
jgi:DNA-binding beta-propeller fold protein YncE